MTIANQEKANFQYQHVAKYIKFGTPSLRPIWETDREPSIYK